MADTTVVMCDFFLTKTIRTFYFGKYHCKSRHKNSCGIKKLRGHLGNIHYGSVTRTVDVQVVETSCLLAEITYFWKGNKYTTEQTMQTAAHFE